MYEVLPLWLCLRPMTEISYYIHDLNPVLVHIAGPLAVRWYGLAYLLGFLLGYRLLIRVSREGLFKMPEAKIADFVILLAVYGVVIGGRVGYTLFYNFGDWLKDPLYVFRLWDGGMASHGAMIATALFLVVYGKRNGYSFRHLCDHVCLGVPVGIFFGRIANFINGELWGRVTDVRWAVIFPQEAGLDYTAASDTALMLSYLKAGYLHPRHPSQLYEALGEGLILFLVLWWVRHQPWSRRDGWLTAVFAIGYGVTRIVVEFFREPDSTVYLGWMTKGQSLSLVLMAAGLIVAWSTWTEAKNAKEPL